MFEKCIEHFRHILDTDQFYSIWLIQPLEVSLRQVTAVKPEARSLFDPQLRLGDSPHLTSQADFTEQNRSNFMAQVKVGYVW